MDLVKSSPLVVEDMSDVSGTMRQIVQDVLDEVDPGWRDRVIPQPAGDGVGLAFMEDPTQPARTFASRWPAELNLVRLGINTGPVDVKDDVLTGRPTCQGDGIVAAQRVMSVNSEGLILMTQEYVSQLPRFRNWSDEISPVGWRDEKDHRMFVYELLQDGLVPLASAPDTNEENVRRLEERIGKSFVEWVFAGEGSGIISDASGQEGLMDRAHRTDWKSYQSIGIKVLHASVSKDGAIVISSHQPGQIVKAHDLLLEMMAQRLGYYLTRKGRGDTMQRRRKNRI